MSKVQLAAFPKGYMDSLCNGSMRLSDWIHEAALLGVDGLELYPLFLQDTGASSLRSIRQQAVSEGLKIPMMCTSPDFTHPDPEFRTLQVEQMRRMMQVMTELCPDGFRSCRVLSGQRRTSVSESDGIRWTVECIETLLEDAEKLEVMLVMENHYKDGYWTEPEFAQSSHRFLQITDQLKSEWFGINYDPSNALLAGEEPLEVLEKVKHRVKTMHASDRYLLPGFQAEDLKRDSGGIGYSNMLSHGVIGKGMNDYDAIFTTLREVGFHGWISIEDGVNGFEELQASTDFLKAKIAQYF